MNQLVTFDASKFSFKGNSTAILKMKEQIEKVQNEIGLIVAETYGLYDIKIGKQIIRVPKSWIIIL